MANQITVSGNLVADAEVKDANGKPIIEFRMADNYMKDKDPNYFRVGYWMTSTSSADKLASYLKKGTKVTAFGNKFNARLFKNKEGEAGMGLQFTAQNIDFSAPLNNDSQSNTKSSLDDEIPF